MYGTVRVLTSDYDLGSAGGRPKVWHFVRDACEKEKLDRSVKASYQAGTFTNVFHLLLLHLRHPKEGANPDFAEIQYVSS